MIFLRKKIILRIFKISTCKYFILFTNFIKAYIHVLFLSSSSSSFIKILLLGISLVAKEKNEKKEKKDYPGVQDNFSPKAQSFNTTFKEQRKYNQKYQNYLIQLRGKVKFYIQINRLMIPLARSYYYSVEKE